MKLLNKKLFISAAVIVIGGLILFTGGEKPSEVNGTIDSGVKEKFISKMRWVQKLRTLSLKALTGKW